MCTVKTTTAKGHPLPIVAIPIATPGRHVRPKNNTRENKHPRSALLPLQTKISLLLTTRVKVPEEGGRSRNKKATKAGRKSRILTNFPSVNLYQMANVAGWWRVRRKMNRRWRKMTQEGASVNDVHFGFV